MRIPNLPSNHKIPMSYMQGESWTSSDGVHMTIRAVHPSDSDQLNAMVKRLSFASKKNRFHFAVNELSEKTLHYMTTVDFSSHCAYVVTTKKNGINCILADARYVVRSMGNVAEFSIVVEDRVQCQGIGLRMMKKLLKSAEISRLQHLVGDVLSSNFNMLRLARRCGFECRSNPDEPQLVRIEKSLFPNKQIVVSKETDKYSMRTSDMREVTTW
jgi:acetyltransferase